MKDLLTICFLIISSLTALGQKSTSQVHSISNEIKLNKQEYLYLKAQKNADVICNNIATFIHDSTVIKNYGADRYKYARMYISFLIVYEYYHKKHNNLHEHYPIDINDLSWAFERNKTMVSNYQYIPINKTAAVNLLRDNLKYENREIKAIKKLDSFQKISTSVFEFLSMDVGINQKTKIEICRDFIDEIMQCNHIFTAFALVSPVDNIVHEYYFAKNMIILPNKGLHGGVN